MTSSKCLHLSIMGSVLHLSGYIGMYLLVNCNNMGMGCVLHLSIMGRVVV